MKVSSRRKDLSDDPKNEGEALHIVSPSTIPLTLGEEIAVLVLPRLLYQNRRETHQHEFSPLSSKHFDKENGHSGGSHAGNAGCLSDRPGTHRSQLLHYLVRQSRDACE